MNIETYVQSYNLENPKFQCINKEHWSELIIHNTHSYAKAILIFANELAYSLEQLIKDEEFTITIEQLDHCGRDIEPSLGGITGFMYSYAIRILKDTWKYGKELVALHNRNEIEDFKNKMNRSFKSLEERLNEITQQEKSKNVNLPNIRQKPKKGEVYYFLDSAGYVSCTHWTGSEDDLFRFNIGNCFTTEEETNDFKENLLTKQLLKDLALELNKGKKINWEDDTQIKHCLHILNEFGQGLERDFVTLREDYNVYCLDQDFVKIAKQRIGEERLIKLIKSGV